MMLEIQVLSSNRHKTVAELKLVNGILTLPPYNWIYKYNTCKKPQQICFYSKRPHTTTNMNKQKHGQYNS
jgi:hypothetical protein